MGARGCEGAREGARGATLEHHKGHARLCPTPCAPALSEHAAFPAREARGAARGRRVERKGRGRRRKRGRR
eukprot:2694565-Rhodomonas_salina.1